VRTPGVYNFNGRFAVLEFLVTAMLFPAVSSAEPTPSRQPYELEGKRLVFTSWAFVRPCGPPWTDRASESALAAESDNGDQDSALHTPWGVRIRAHKPSERRKLVIAPEKPWESAPIVIAECIVEDNGVYKAWAECSAGPCYLESDDGLTWRRPIVGLVEFRSSKENNLIPSAPKRNVFIDPSSEYRYKSVWEASFNQDEFDAYRQRRPDAWSTMAKRQIGNEVRYVGLKGAVSRDGFTWEEIDHPLVIDHTDTVNVGYYDARREKYIIYVRKWNTLPRAPGYMPDTWDSWLAHGRRCIGRIEADDFRNLPLSQLIVEPSPEMPPTFGLYTNCFTWIPEAPDLFLMFPAAYDVIDDTTQTWIASSLDGKAWHWIPGNPLFETAPFGQWDGGCLFAYPPLMELGDGSFALPYIGANVPHKYPRGLVKTDWAYAIWPHGRLIAIEAEERGEFATVPMIPPGQKLYINALTKRTGYVRVALQRCGDTTEIVPGRGFKEAIAVVGDHPRTLVRWQDTDKLGVKPGEAVSLLFKLNQAEIFSLAFE